MQSDHRSKNPAALSQSLTVIESPSMIHGIKTNRTHLENKIRELAEEKKNKEQEERSMGASKNRDLLRLQIQRLDLQIQKNQIMLDLINSDNGCGIYKQGAASTIQEINDKIYELSYKLQNDLADALPNVAIPRLPKTLPRELHACPFDEKHLKDQSKVMKLNFDLAKIYVDKGNLNKAEAHLTTSIVFWISIHAKKLLAEVNQPIPSRISEWKTPAIMDWILDKCMPHFTQWFIQKKFSDESVLSMIDMLMLYIKRLDNMHLQPSPSAKMDIKFDRGDLHELFNYIKIMRALIETPAGRRSAQYETHRNQLTEIHDANEARVAVWDCKHKVLAQIVQLHPPGYLKTIQGFQGTTLLIMAATTATLSLVDWLINQGMDVYETDKTPDKNNILFYALSFNLTFQSLASRFPSLLDYKNARGQKIEELAQAYPSDPGVISNLLWLKTWRNLQAALPPAISSLLVLPASAGSRETKRDDAQVPLSPSSSALVCPPASAASDDAALANGSTAVQPGCFARQAVPSEGSSSSMTSSKEPAYSSTKKPTYQAAMTAGDYPAAITAANALIEKVKEKTEDLLKQTQLIEEAENLLKQAQLINAIASGNVKTVETLLQNTKITIRKKLLRQARGKEKKSALMIAYEKNNASLQNVLLFFHEDIDFDMQDEHGQTILHHLVIRKDEKAFLNLLAPKHQKTRRFSIDMPDNQGRTILHWACELDQETLVQRILRLHPTLELKDKDGKCAVELTQSQTILNLFNDNSDRKHTKHSKLKIQFTEPSSKSIKKFSLPFWGRSMANTDEKSYAGIAAATSELKYPEHPDLPPLTSPDFPTLTPDRPIPTNTELSLNVSYAATAAAAATTLEEKHPELSDLSTKISDDYPSLTPGHTITATTQQPFNKSYAATAATSEPKYSEHPDLPPLTSPDFPTLTPDRPIPTNTELSLNVSYAATAAAAATTLEEKHPELSDLSTKISDDYPSLTPGHTITATTQQPFNKSYAATAVTSKPKHPEHPDLPSLTSDDFPTMTPDRPIPANTEPSLNVSYAATAAAAAAATTLEEKHLGLSDLSTKTSDDYPSLTPGHTITATTQQPFNKSYAATAVTSKPKHPEHPDLPPLTSPDFPTLTPDRTIPTNTQPSLDVSYAAAATATTTLEEKHPELSDLSTKISDDYPTLVPGHTITATTQQPFNKSYAATAVTSKPKHQEHPDLPPLTSPDFPTMTPDRTIPTNTQPLLDVSYAAAAAATTSAQKRPEFAYSSAETPMTVTDSITEKKSQTSYAAIAALIQPISSKPEKSKLTAKSLADKNALTDSKEKSHTSTQENEIEKYKAQEDDLQSVKNNAWQKFHDSDYASAFKLFEKLKKEDHLKANAYLGMASCKEMQESFNEALQFYDQAIDCDSDYFSAHYYKAKLCQKIFLSPGNSNKFDREQMRAIFENLVNKFNDIPQVHIAYIDHLFSANRLCLAFFKAIDAVKKFPNHIQAHFFVIEYYRKTSQHNEVISYYEHFLNIQLNWENTPYSKESFSQPINLSNDADFYLEYIRVLHYDKDGNLYTTIPSNIQEKIDNALAQFRSQFHKNKQQMSALQSLLNEVSGQNPAQLIDQPHFITNTQTNESSIPIRPAIRPAIRSLKRI